MYDNPMHTDTAKGVLTPRLATHQPDLIPQGNMDVISACDTQHACLREYDVQDDPTSILALLTEPKVIKFDSGASRCMSGDPDRIRVSRPITRPVRITGFNGIGSSPTSMGVNTDGKTEYYVEDMPRHLTLLCANAYCQEGCAVLFEDGGLVLQMNQAELTALKEFLRTYPVVKHLKVNNRTYEVDQLEDTHEALTVIEVNEERMRGTLQDALCLVLLLASLILR